MSRPNPHNLIGNNTKKQPNKQNLTIVSFYLLLPETTIISIFRFNHGRCTIIDKKRRLSDKTFICKDYLKKICKCYLRRICYLSFQVKLTQVQAQQLKTKELVT